MTARPQDVALLPCPFCGGRAKSKSEFVRCVECGAQMNFGDEDGMDSIISSWNRRSDAALASAQAREEELRALLGGVECQRDANWQAYTEAEARAERLAEALREIANQGPHYGRDGTRETWRHWAEIAKAALSTNAATQTGETNEAAE